MKKTISFILSIALFLSTLPLSAITVGATTSGNYTYSVSDGKAIITGYNTEPSGTLSFPDTIDGYPVVMIGGFSFQNCTKISKVIVPEGVTSIGPYAFYGCTSLLEISIPNTVTEIGTYSFYGCSFLYQIVIPDSVEFIGQNSFYRCTNLKKMTIPFVGGSEYANTFFNYIFGGKKSDENVCYLPSSLTTVIISDKCTSIPENGFYGCDEIQNIYLPKNLKEIGSNAFQGCSGLKNVYVSDFMTWSNLSFETATSNPMYYADTLYVDNVTMSGDYVIPEGVTQIPAGAFKNNTALTSVSIPNTVKIIGANAFEGCTGLTEVLIPDSVETIMGSAFKGCNKLSSVTIGNGTVDIGAYAFNQCTTLKDVVMGTSVENIGYRVFADCANLEKVQFGINTKNIGEGAFENCYMLNNLTLPEGVLTIGQYAFRNCTSIETVRIPGTIKSVSYDAFEQCSGLKKLVVDEGVEELLQDSFRFCSNLTDIVLPKSLTYIGAYVFSGDTNIKHVLYKGSQTEWNNISKYNSNLTWQKIHYNTTGDEIQYIDTDTCSIHWVSYCSVCDKYTTELIKPFNHTYIDKVCETCGLEEGWDYSLTDSEITITGYTGDKKDIVIPTTIEGLPVVAIGNKAFQNNTVIESVIIPESVNTIEYLAFDGCTSIKNIIVPKTVTNIGSGAFEGCTALESITVPFVGGSATQNKYFGYIFGAYKYSYSKDSVPASLKYVKIFDGDTTIFENAFYECENIVSIVLPKSITSIEYRGFYNCKGIEHVSFAGTADEWYDISIFGSGNGNLTAATCHYENNDHVYTYIGEDRCTIRIEGYCSVCDKHKITILSDGGHAFGIDGNCTVCGIQNTWQYSITNGIAYINSYTGVAKEVVVPSEIEGLPVAIGPSAFNGNTNITKVTITEGVLQIGNYAFRKCLNLKEVILPSTVTYCGVDAFEDCTALEGVHIADLTAWMRIDFNSQESNPLYYAQYLYLNGNKITEIFVPNEITELGHYAFYGYKGLESIHFHDGFKKIGLAAFYNCTGLSSIEFPDSIEEIDGFYGCTALTTIVIPDKNLNSIGYLAFYNTGYFNDSNNWENGALYIGKHLIDADNTISKNYVIKDGTLSIGQGAFRNCIYLESVSIPNSIKTIDVNTFMYCDSLKSVTIPSSVDDILWDVFVDCDDNMIINCVPNSYAHTYAISHDYLFRFICEACSWDEATCTTAKTCSVCGLIEGEVRGHVYDDENDVHCNFCEYIRLESGDVNEDGVVNIKDATLLRRYVAEWDDVTVNMWAADVNRDGVVNIKDATILRRYVAEWDGVVLQ